MNKEEYNEYHRQYQRKYRLEHPEKSKASQLKKRYGITYEQFNQMFISQDGCCGICKNKFKSGKDIHVDHNHKTKQVRQLLCTTCNIVLGYCKEDILILEKCIDYLKKWNV